MHLSQLMSHNSDTPLKGAIFTYSFFLDSLPIAETGYFGEGAVSFYLDELQCNGSELQLTDCSYRNRTDPCVVDDAGHVDTGVICRGKHGIQTLVK